MAEDASKTPARLIPVSGFVIEFPGVSDAQAGVFAGERERDIRNALVDNGVGADVDRLKTDEETQDVGTILAIILGANSTIAIAYGIARWLARRNRTRVSLRTRDRRFERVDAESKDVEKCLRALPPQKPTSR
jgi:hypothetical protein